MSATPTPAKQFVTANFPGFPDGTPLVLRRALQLDRGPYNPEAVELFAARPVAGSYVVALIPLTPEAFDRFVRVVDALPGDAP